MTVSQNEGSDVHMAIDVLYDNDADLSLILSLIHI